MIKNIILKVISIVLALTAIFAMPVRHQLPEAVSWI